MTLEFFKAAYIKLRGLNSKEVDEAFMAGAHTVVLMLQSGDSIDELEKEVNKYLVVKQLETDFEHNTVH